uniref:Single-stranded-DNA-specific exonuclease RecJ n=1 Tax=candidate division WWE3 bacterium TaxID=2053526 RepID=A0A7C4XI74_UNCKA
MALATVTDLQPLFKYNRSIVKEGLEILNSNPPVGLKVLKEVSGRNQSEITTYDLGWLLGPRINATGRIGSAEDALNLLLEKDIGQALVLAKKLNDLNVDRQDKTSEMYDLASEFDPSNLPRIIVSAHKDYHEGIIGLVAAKLVQKHYRPSIAISINGEFSKGSARSVDGLDIISFLRIAEDLFENLGGHPMAAGFTLKTEKLDEFCERMESLSVEMISDEVLQPQLRIDCAVSLSDVDLSFVKNINRLKPFGNGNPSPVFACFDLGIVGIETVGRDNSHLILKLMDGGVGVHKTIFFGRADLTNSLAVGDKVDIAYTAEINDYKGKEYLNLVLKDMQIKAANTG